MQWSVRASLCESRPCVERQRSVYRGRCGCRGLGPWMHLWPLSVDTGGVVPTCV